MKNGAPLAFVAIAALSGMTAIRALFEGHRGSRSVSHTSLASIKDANLDADGVFFRPDMMQVFQTRLEAGPFDGRFFVTSEQFTSMRGKKYPRRFTVREAMPDGSIATIGEFQQYATKDEAVRAAKEAK